MKAGRDGEMTFQEIGSALGISKERAWQLYMKGMEKLKRSTIGKQWSKLHVRNGNSKL